MPDRGRVNKIMICGVSGYAKVVAAIIRFGREIRIIGFLYNESSETTQIGSLTTAIFESIFLNSPR